MNITKPGLKNRPIFFIAFTFLFLFSSCVSAENLEDGLYARFDTSKGKILLTLEFEKTPMTVMNFIGLAEGAFESTRGEKARFYNGLKFHRVIENFMIQGGCPLGDGTGGPGYNFPDEFNQTLRHSGPGILSMANSGPGTNGSQFFITHLETPWLDDKHTVFGHVVEGMDVVNKIVQDDVIRKIDIIRVGAQAKAFKADRVTFDQMIEKAAKTAEEAVRAQAQKNLSFIDNTWPNAVLSDTGLRYVVSKNGSGTALTQNGSAVSIHYTASLLDGTVFDSSVESGEPVELMIGQVIPGWNEGMTGMKKGEKRLLIIPPELAFGAQGYPGVVPPDSYILIEVEIIEL